MSEHRAGSFFNTDDDIWFSPTKHTRGPWNANHCHAGPPTGLAARAVERLLPAQRLTRLTINLLKPIPFSGFSVLATLQKEGRMVSISHFELTDGEGQVCAHGEGLHMLEQPAINFPSARRTFGSLEQTTVGRFPIARTLHDKPTFNGDGVETRYPTGQDHTPGPTTAWLRTVPLLSTEKPSAFQRICPLADCGNAFSRNAEPWEVNFMNPDLTIVLFRDPEGDWLGSQSNGYWEPGGIGLADAALFDRKGMVGRALQTLLLRAAH